ncbi:MAG TPA: Ku protein [Labilithrix sp.]|nr:Ku protein [Labilithrix sp.]
MLAVVEHSARKKGDESTAAGTEPRNRASSGAGRGIWSGSISFGLLQIPVTLYTAESRGNELHFRLLDKHDLSPIRYERVSSTTGKPVEWKDIVKGYELEKDQFVIMEPEDFAKANVKATQTIDIQDFVPRDQIDTAYFSKPYWLVPQKRAMKAYILLRDALTKMNAVAIATFVLRTREHLVAIMPAEDALMLEILRFGHELKDAGTLPLPSASEAKSISDRELAMAQQLIEGMMTDWDPNKYRDRYFQDVMKVIEEKAKTGMASEHHARVPGTVAHDVVDLLDLLKRSIAKTGRAANVQEAEPKKTGGASESGGSPKTSRKSKRRRAA